MNAQNDRQIAIRTTRKRMGKIKDIGDEIRYSVWKKENGDYTELSAKIYIEYNHQDNNPEQIRISVVKNPDVVVKVIEHKKV